MPAAPDDGEPAPRRRPCGARLRPHPPWDVGKPRHRPRHALSLPGLSSPARHGVYALKHAGLNGDAGSGRRSGPSSGSWSSTSRSSSSSSRSSPATTPQDRSRFSCTSPTSSSPGPRCSTSLCSPTVPPSLPGEVPCHQCSGHDSHRRLHRDELHFQFDAGRYRGWVAELAVRLEEDSPPPSGGSCNMRNPCCKGERKHSCKEIEGESSQGMESI